MTAFSSSSSSSSSSLGANSQSNPSSYLDVSLLETIVSLVPGNVYWARLDGTILGANDAQAKAFGFVDKNKLVGKKLREVCANQMVARQHEANNERVLKEHKTISFEEWDEQNGVGRICYLANRAPLQHQGITMGVLCVSIDITKQKILEQQLRSERDNAIHLVKENESLIYGLYQSITGKRPQERMPIDHLIKSFRVFYENILAVLPFHVYWLDRTGKYLGCNDNQAKSAGLKSRADVVGLRNADLPWNQARPDIAKLLDETNEKIMSAGQPLSIEEPGEGEEGKTKTFLTRKIPIRESSGEVIGLVGISVDITADKSLEEMKLKVMTTEEGVKTARLLAQIIAHELRTPFSAMDFMMDSLAQYFSPMLKEAQTQGIVPERAVKYLEAIPVRMSKILYSANRFIDMMLMMGNIDNLKAELVPLSMKQVIESAFKTYPFMEGDEELLSLNLTQDFKIKGDLKLLEHVIFNLLKNAIYYVKAAQKGKIEIWLEPAKTQTPESLNILHFKDTGKGISADIMPFIFEPFFSRTRHGTGIGLAFCRRVMQEHHGMIRCESMPGEFAHFFLSFPALF